LSDVNKGGEEMAKFQYKAMNMSGNVVQGIYEAPNQQAVVDMIRQKSFYQLEITEMADHKDLKDTDFFSKISVKDISIYCRQFSSILKAGVTLIQCLSMLSNQTENPILKIITRDVREQVQKGTSLSQAMNKHIKKLPPILINMVEAGEASGTLDKSFEVMSEHFEKQHKTQQKVKSAMRYPIIVVIVAVLVVIFMLVNVVPVFSSMFASSGAELPLPTKILMSMSNFVQHRGYLLILAAIIVGSLVKLYLSSYAGRLGFDKLKFSLPILGKFQTNSVTANFARTMSTLMSTGVSITEALNITGKILGNVYAKQGIDKVIKQVQEGRGLYLPIKSIGLFPPMLENMVKLGEDSGTLDEMLHKTAEFYEDEVDRGTETLTGLMEPLIIVLLGGVVAFIVLAIALPMFDSYSFVGK
jgi:type IV pilus assembly protein PilC